MESEFRPLGIREIFSTTLTTCRSRFGALAAISLVLIGVPSVLEVVGAWSYEGYRPVDMVMILAVLVAGLIAGAACIRVAAQECAGVRSSMFSSVAIALRRLTRVVGISLISVAAVIGVAAVMIGLGSILLLIVAPDWASDTTPNAIDIFDMANFSTEVLLIWLWSLLLALPALLLAGLWFMAPQAVIIENLHPIDSLRRSWKLVSVRIWRVCGTLSLAGLAVVAANVILSWIFPAGWAYVLVNLLTLPFLSVFGTVIYLDLRARYEDLNRETLAAELSTTA